MYIYISTCARYLDNERRRNFYQKKKEKESTGANKKLRALGHVVGGNELILKTSLKNIQHF